MKNLFFAAAIGASAAFVPAPASAATIVYSFSGNYSGNISGNDFSGPATLTGIGDTSSLFNPDSNVTAVTLSSLTLTLDSISSMIAGSNVFFVNRSAGTGGFALSSGGSFRTLLLSSSFLGYDGVSSIAAVGGEAVALPYSFVSDAGPVTLTNASNVRFSAVAAAVPEPATWAMMMLGFGAVGYAMRRRSKAVVRFA